MRITEILQQCPDITLNVSANDLRELFHEWRAEAEANRKREQETRQAEALLTTAEVKAKLGVSSTTLWRWQNSGYLTPCKMGRKVLYRQSDIDLLLKGGEL